MAGLEGRTLDRYELQRPLGRGGMADVYLGYDPRFEREVAVKVFKREDEDLLRRFIREAQLMASLSNSHLMPVYDAGTSLLDGVNVYYIVMPFMQGGTLRERIRRGPLSPAQTCRYLREIADALDYIHQKGIIHRDIKSSNVLLDADGHCYLADFGIARMTTSDATQATSTGSILGTVDYIAPELFETNQRANVRSDLYSLGVLLYEMVTGRLPFSGENQIAVAAMHVSKQPPMPRSFVPNLSPAVEQVVLKGLEKRPELRYASAGALADAFCYAASQPVSAIDELSTRVVSPNFEKRTIPPSDPDQKVYLPPPLEPRPMPLGQGTTGYSYEPVTRQVAPYSAQPVHNTEVVSAPETSRLRISVFIGLLVLLLILVPVGYVLIAHPFNPNNAVVPTATSQPTPNLTATAQATNVAATQQAATATAAVTATAQAHASATAQAVNATATSIAGATVTVQAQATATASVGLTATAGQPSYADPLTNKDSSTTQAAQWDDNSNCTFHSDGYHVAVQPGLLGAATLNGCREAGEQFQNFAVQADVIINSGYSGGVFFDVSTGNNVLGSYSGYLFEIDTNGKYRISRANNFNAQLTPLRDWTTSSALKTGNGAKNTLLVVAQHGTFSFYINGTFLGPPLQDQSFTTGNIAFLATTAANGSAADVVYSNLNVYKLS